MAGEKKLKKIYYKDISDDTYQFIFIPGSGGSFFKACFYAYVEHLEPTKYKHGTTFTIESDGEYIGENPGKGKRHIHISQDIQQLIKEQDKHKLVAVTYTQADLPIIWKRNYTTYESKWIDDNPLECLNAFPELENCMDDPVRREQAYYNSQIRIHSDDNFLSLVKQLDLCLEIKYKTIQDGDLNQQLADYFKCDPLDHVQDFINLYREKNQKYFKLT